MLTKLLSSLSAESCLRAFLITVVLLLTFFFTFFIPPIDKPDENVHFYKALGVSQGRFGCIKQHDALINPIPLDAFLYVNSFWTGGDLKTTITIDDIKFVNEKSSCVLPFYYYIVPGVVIGLLSSVGADMSVIFYSGRVVNAVLALALLYFSVRKLPLSFQLISLYVYSLPMVSFQISSYSKDAYHVAFGVVVFNLMLHMIYHQKTHRKNLFFFALSAVTFVLTRIQYVPFLSLFLALPKSGRKLKHPFNRNILLAVITFLIATGTLFLAISNNVYLSPYNTNTKLSYYAQIDPKQQLFFILTHPVSFFITCVNTVSTYFIFFVKGMIGILGWLDKPLPNYIYIFYVMLGIVIISVLASSKEIARVKQLGLFFFGVVFTTLLSLFTAMYLYGSPIGFYLIYGLQGRYFIMLIPLVMLILALALRNSVKLLHAKMNADQKK